MRIAILGTGAIGGVLAGCLSDTNAELVCVSRGRTARDLLEGLTLFTPEGSVEMIPGAVSYTHLTLPTTPYV